jgi:hypothetical protein
MKVLFHIQYLSSSAAAPVSAMHWQIEEQGEIRAKHARCVRATQYVAGTHPNFMANGEFGGVAAG